MSNHLAIATVTATLQRILQAAVQADVDGVRVTTLSPRNVGGSTEAGVNLYLFQVQRNAPLYNTDLPPFRNRQGGTGNFTPLDLSYVVSFYGNDADLEPQRLMGSALRTLNDCTQITREAIQATLQDPTFRYLEASNLVDQVQSISVRQEELALEELSKIWSVFMQAPYALSLVYKVSAVVVDSAKAVDRALPVRGCQVEPVVPLETLPPAVTATVVRPTITTAQVVRQMNYGGSNDLGQPVFDTIVAVTVATPVGLTQTVTLLLHEWRATSWGDERPVSRQCAAINRDRETGELMFEVAQLKAADYLIQLQVDGATSLLQVDQDPSSPSFEQYVQPRLTIGEPMRLVT
jgi:hypothetical protein